MLTGRVVWFAPDKGYGFVSTPNAEDVFVHIKELLRCGIATLKDGAAIEFEIGQGVNGKTCAVNIRHVARGNTANHAPRTPSGGYYPGAQRQF